MSITLNIVNSILREYGVVKRVKSIDLFNRALTHSSVSDDHYERLEFLGDSVIHLIYTNYIYDRYAQDEGFMTRLRSKMERKEGLCVISEVLNLPKYVSINLNDVYKNSKRSTLTPKERGIPKCVKEDIFESFVGALKQTFDYDTCNIFVINVIEKNICLSDLLHQDNNYKEKLNHLFHTLHKNPKYVRTCEREDLSGIMMFQSTVYDVEEDKPIASGWGVTVKRSEQAAAKLALSMLSSTTKKLEVKELIQHEFVKLTFKDVLNTTFVNKQGVKASRPDTTFGVYISSISCGACKPFNRYLKTLDVPIIFCSNDKSKQECETYFNEEHGNYLSYYYDDPCRKSMIDLLKDQGKVQMPYVAVFDKDCNLLSTNGLTMLYHNITWVMPHVINLSIMDNIPVYSIENEPALILLLDDEDDDMRDKFIDMKSPYQKYIAFTTTKLVSKIRNATKLFDDVVCFTINNSKITLHLL